MPGNILLNQVFVTYNLHQKSRKSDNRKFLKINRVRFFLVHFYPISAFGLLFPSFSPTGCQIFVIPVYMLLNQVFVPYNLHQKSQESDNRKFFKLTEYDSWRGIVLGVKLPCALVWYQMTWFGTLFLKNAAWKHTFWCKSIEISLLGGLFSPAFVDNFFWKRVFASFCSIAASSIEHWASGIELVCI